MKDPKNIIAIAAGALYEVPQYKITEEGIQDAEPVIITFCKGNKSDMTMLNQTGLFTETLIETAKQYLESVNKGDLATRETAMASTKLDEALLWLGKRADDRKRREVQSTYEK
jgi:hypothetical protein